MINFADAKGALIEEIQYDAHPDVVDTSSLQGLEQVAVQNQGGHLGLKTRYYLL